ncbi:MAG: class I SAM-dependent methyltransferase [Candidatus Bathyarchaeia archaeon]
MVGNYILLILPVLFFAFVFYLTVVTRRDAAYVPTPEPVVRRMLEMAELKPGETLYDLGSGDGRIVAAAARDFGANAVGVEIDKSLVSLSRRNIAAQNLGERAKIIHGNFYYADLRNADVVTLYLRQNTNDRLAAKFKKELRPGTRIVSYTFVMTGWTPAKVDNESHIYMYII